VVATVSEIRIDELARRSGLTVDTIRFYQREGLLPEAARAGRAKVYGQEHLDRLAQIRDLQARRFSLAAIKALLETERPGLVDGIFSGEGSLSYSLDDLVERSGASAGLAHRLRDAGLLRDPREFGRDAYDATDLDVLRAVVELERHALPEDVIVALASIYVHGVERMQLEVLDLFAGRRGHVWGDEEITAFQNKAASAAGQLLPLVTRIVEYVHQRTLQRLTLGAIESGRLGVPPEPSGEGADPA
jgi:DNA-binding transcriptional MerR regulator